MSRVGEPMDVEQEIKKLKARIEMLEQRIYTINQEPRLGPKPEKVYDPSELEKIIERTRRMNG